MKYSRLHEAMAQDNHQLERLAQALADRLSIYTVFHAHAPSKPCDSCKAMADWNKFNEESGNG